MDIQQKASLFASSSALFLAICKFIVGLMSGSMTVVSSGLDSLMDVFMSTMNFYAIRKAAEPADKNHQYGHGKVEDLAAAIQSVVIIVTGGIIIYSSANRFFLDKSITYSSLDAGVMVVSLVFSFVISLTLRRTGKKTESKPLKADALHYTSDLYSNTAAIIAIVLTYYTGKNYFDLCFAVIVGVIIIFSAVKILKSGFSGLLDVSIPEEIEREIRRLLDTKSFPIAGYHKMRSRYAGNRFYTDFHLLICRRLSISEAHEIANRIEKEMQKNIKHIDIVIHVEPCAHECGLTDESCLVLRAGRDRREAGD